MNVELHNEFEYRTLIAPVAAVTNDTAAVSEIIDLANCIGCELVCVLGTNADTDMTRTVLVEHDDASGFGTAVAVPDSDLVGTEAGAATNFSHDKKTFKIGYLGMKRYIRLTVTPADNTGNEFIAGIAVLRKRKGPQSSQVN